MRGADLELRAGEIHGLLGENGAGKSTLIRILAGLYEPDGGEVILNPPSLPSSPLHSGADAGLAFIHQEPVAFPDLSVAENIALLTGYPTSHGFIRWGSLNIHASRVLARLRIDLDPHAKMATLPVATRTMVAIAAAVANEAHTVILDEPTASLSAHDVQSLFHVLRELRSHGIAILFVTHRIDEVMAMCDRVTVLRDGVTVGRLQRAEVTERQLVDLIVGQTHSSGVSTAVGTEEDGFTDEPLFDFCGTRAEGLPGPITFSLRPGEILGFTGSLEAGHHAIGELSFGLKQPVEGRIRLSGDEYRPSTPQAALALGIRFVPADRNLFGIAPHLTLQENLFLNPSAAHRRRLVGTRKERLEAAEALRRFDVRPPNPRAEASTLSGGNAQKLVLTRSFLGEPKLVVLTEPTSGVDIGARAAIYDTLRSQARRGVGVIVISSDFSEIEEVCDRCFIMRRGRIARELRGAALTVPAITSASL